LRSREPKIRRLGEIYNRRNLIKKYSGISEVKELDAETGLYYYGARYLDPRTSRWLSGDPAIYEGDYLPSAPINDEARKRNQNLPGMGGIFNYVNMHVYHYGGNNPIKLIDPDGRVLTLDSIAYLIEREEYHKAIEYLMRSRTGRELIRTLDESDVVFRIVIISAGDRHGSYYNPLDKTIYWSPYQGLETRKGIQSAAIALAHEFGHARRHLEGVQIYYDGSGDMDEETFNRVIRIPEENRIIRTVDNAIARQLREPRRKGYNDGRIVITHGATTRNIHIMKMQLLWGHL